MHPLDPRQSAQNRTPKIRVATRAAMSLNVLLPGVGVLLLAVVILLINGAKSGI